MDFWVCLLVIEMTLLLNCQTNILAKTQDGLQLSLEPVQSKQYSQNGCYLHYTSSYHIAKYLKRNPPTQKCASVQEPVAKQRRPAVLPSSLKANNLFREEMCFLRPDPCNPSRWKTCILCRTADRGKGIKVSSMSYCRYVLLYQWRWKFKLNSTWSSNPGFQEINEKPMRFMDTMLKFARKYQDGSHNSHWNLVCLTVKMNIFLLPLHLCGTSQNKLKDLVKISLNFLKTSIESLSTGYSVKCYLTY